MGESFRWVIPVVLSWILLLFTFLLFPRILPRVLPKQVKSLPPGKKFLLGLAVILATISVISAVCLLVAVFVW